MAHSIINSSAYNAEKDGQSVGFGTVPADAVNVFGIDDFTMTIAPESTIWSNTAEPMGYTIVFKNKSGIVVDSVTITDTMPTAGQTAPGLTLDVASILASISPSIGVTIDTSESTETELVVTATGIVDGAAVLTITFDTNYVPPVNGLL